MKKNNEEKRCHCGRVIIDPNNKTGLCPKCEKKAANAGAGIGLVGLAFGIKKYGPKIVKGAMKLVKRK